MIIGGVDFGRIASVKYSEEISKRQSRFISGDGEMRVRDIDDFITRKVTWTFPRLSNTYKEVLRAMIGAWNFAGTPVNITDDYGYSWSGGRIIDTKVKFQHRLGRFWEARLTFWYTY